jgi:hypothetical protein
MKWRRITYSTPRGERQIPFLGGLNTIQKAALTEFALKDGCDDETALRDQLNRLS